MVRGTVLRLRMRFATLLASLAMLLASASVAMGHPIHTTITDLGYRRENRTVRATIRVFADDFGRAVLGLGSGAPAPPSAAVADSAAETWVRANFRLSRPDGTAIPLAFCGIRRSGDLVWVCVEAGWTGSLRGMRVENRMLFDLYRDQINIVQAQLDGTRASLLFTRGAAPKPIA